MNSDTATQSGRDIRQALCERVALARAQHDALCIVAGNSKAGYRRERRGETLSVLEHSGIIDYEPAELVITARAGTPLQQIKNTLREQGQMLAFEPPCFGQSATLGGTIACGLSGPRRPYAGAARDFVLGVNIINGHGQALSFGGRVMKNVAGYDLSRLMVGALGTLGLITEISLKLLPAPEQEITLLFEYDTATAIKRCNTWAQQALPVSATCIMEDGLYLRLSGCADAIQAARNKIGGEVLQHSSLWSSLQEQEHPFFNGANRLWRISVAPATAPLVVDGEWLIEWGGGQRWLKTDAEAQEVYRVARQAGGHATLHDKNLGHRFLQTLDEPLLSLHRRLKLALDPANILNPGAMYPEL